jgi:hypothetical protein
VTQDGRDCIAWNSDNFWADRFASQNLHGFDTNYCRNPDGDLRPWCLIPDGLWQYCDIPVCEEDRMNSIFGQEAPVSKPSEWKATHKNSMLEV